MSNVRSERGTTLVEAIVAIGLLAGAVVSMAGLASVAIRTSTIARERSMATLLAVQKMEVLCRDASALAPSAANAWSVDTPGQVEYLDQYGRPLAGARGVYVRRWAVAPLPADANLVAIQVDVAMCRARSGASGCGDPVSQARLASVRSRLAW
jgi:Tfp pilus assembly protein PilV